jgi:transposase
VQAAWGAARKKNSYFQAQFLRLKTRHGAKKAAIAVAASILTTGALACLEMSVECQEQHRQHSFDHFVDGSMGLAR